MIGIISESEFHTLYDRHTFMLIQLLMVQLVSVETQMSLSIWSFCSLVLSHLKIP